jgi:hypothetical protein
MRHDRNGMPYNLKVCERNGKTVQDVEHILLDCLQEHLVSLCTSTPAGLPTLVEESSTRENLFEPARCVWCGPFYGWVPDPSISHDFYSAFFNLVT